jgi:hypothetical protein
VSGRRLRGAAQKIQLKKIDTLEHVQLTNPKTMAGGFKPDIGKQIAKSEAIKWKDKYEKDRKKDTESVFFGRDAILAILSSGCAGISFIFVRKKKDESSGDETDKNYKDDLVMVGTTEDGVLLWNDNPPTTSATSLTAGSNTYDQSHTCPPYCPS